MLKWPGYLPSCDEGGSLLMGLVKHTIGISRADLTRDCLQELRLWPGCGTVESVAVLGDMHGRFTLHVVNYGLYGLKKSTSPTAQFDASNGRSYGTFI